MKSLLLMHKISMETPEFKQMRRRKFPEHDLMLRNFKCLDFNVYYFNVNLNKKLYSNKIKGKTEKNEINEIRFRKNNKENLPIREHVTFLY